jgi:hypothetical protein
MVRDNVLIPVNGGICNSISLLFFAGKIDIDEKLAVKNYVRAYKPTEDNWLSEFTKNEYWKGPYSAFWWIPSFNEPLTIPIRLAYLDALINNLKSSGNGI